MRTNQLLENSRIAGLLLASSMLALTVNAQITWNGGGTDDNWSTDANWGGTHLVNDGTAALVFDGSTRLSPNADQAWQIASITFAATAGAFTVGGSDLAPPGTAPVAPTDFVVNSSGNTQTIGNNFATLDNEVFNASTADLVFNGNMVTTGNGLGVRGAGNTTINGAISGDGFLNKDESGTLTLTGANTYSRNTFINQGTLQVNGSITASPTVSIFAGSTLTGNGAINNDVILGNGGPSPAVNNGTVSPGNGVGTLAVGSMSWNGNAHYTWEINKASGTEGSNPGTDLLTMGGGLTINADPAHPFTVHVVSLALGGGSGVVSDFNSSQSYSWRIVSTGTGITSFDATKFTIDKSLFQNPLNGGSFNLSVNGNDLDLNFAPVPEPELSVAIAALGLLMFASARRLMRRQAV
jgi:autotransporter-associated beta strand protein